MDLENSCPVKIAVETIGSKWKIYIIYHLLLGTKRFGELKRLLPKITQKMLTQQLRELEADEIVNRKIYSEIPPKVEYFLTELGKTLRPVFKILCKWGEEYLKEKETIAIEANKNL